MDQSRAARWVWAVSGLLLLYASGRSAGLDEARSAVEQWVKTRQLISRTQADWANDKETLEQNLGLLERELKTIEAQFAGVSTNNVEAEKERRDAEESLKSSQAALEQAARFATGFQQEVGDLVPRLPTPLQDLLKPFLNRLPASSAPARLSALDHVQALVGVLNELDKFNNAVAVFSEKRSNGQGAEVSVETVYIGLGAAYFVNEAGDFAGTGIPGPGGWEWKVEPGLASAVKEVLRIYRNERGARFVPLPVQIR